MHRLVTATVLALLVPTLVAADGPPSLEVTPDRTAAHRSESVTVRVDTNRPGLGVSLVGGGIDLTAVTDDAGGATFVVDGSRASLRWDVRYDVVLDADDDRRFGSTGDVEQRFTLGWYDTADARQHDIVPDTLRIVDTEADRVVMARYSVDEFFQVLVAALPCLGCADPVHLEFEWDEDDDFRLGLERIDLAAFEARMRNRSVGDLSVDYAPGGVTVWRLDDPVPFHAADAPPLP